MKWPGQGNSQPGTIVLRMAAAGITPNVTMREMIIIGLWKCIDGLSRVLHSRKGELLVANLISYAATVDGAAWWLQEAGACQVVSTAPHEIPVVRAHCYFLQMSRFVEGLFEAVLSRPEDSHIASEE